MMDLDGALTEEIALRSRLNALVHERAEAQREADRLRTQAERPGADPSLAETAARWSAVVERVSAEIDGQRARLREQEALVARLRADAAGA